MQMHCESRAAQNPNLGLYPNDYGGFPDSWGITMEDIVRITAPELQATRRITTPELPFPRRPTKKRRGTVVTNCVISRQDATAINALSLEAPTQPPNPQEEPSSGSGELRSGGSNGWLRAAGRRQRMVTPRGSVSTYTNRFIEEPAMQRSWPIRPEPHFDFEEEPARTSERL